MATEHSLSPHVPRICYGGGRDPSPSRTPGLDLAFCPCEAREILFVSKMFLRDMLQLLCLCGLSCLFRCSYSRSAYRSAVMLRLSVTGPDSFTGLDTGVIANILISDVCVDVSFIQEYLNVAAYDGILYLDRLYELLLDMHFFYFLNFCLFFHIGHCFLNVIYSPLHFYI